MTQEASVSVRLNPFKLPRHPLIVAEGAAPVPWSPHGRLLGGRPSFTLDPLFHAGCYYVQDSSAMYVGHVFRKMLAMMEKGPVVRVLDLCAAPGGKTTDLPDFGLEIDHVSYMDGCKVYFKDSWIIIRFSGTEPRVRVFAESRTYADARRLVAIAAAFMELPMEEEEWR